VTHLREMMIKVLKRRTNINASSQGLLSGLLLLLIFSKIYSQENAMITINKLNIKLGY
jgi:hypothetical protein